MHLSQAWMGLSGLARRDLSRVYKVVPSLADVAGDSLIRDLWDLGELTKLGVKSDPERDPAVLADRLEERAERADPLEKRSLRPGWWMLAEELLDPMADGGQRLVWAGSDTHFGCVTVSVDGGESGTE